MLYYNHKQNLGRTHDPENYENISKENQTNESFNMPIAGVNVRYVDILCENIPASSIPENKVFR